MFYNPSDNKSTIIIKQSIFWIGLLSMFGMFIFVFIDDVNIPQREITMKVDITNKVNICLPEDEKIFQRSFFNF
jgi:hypothetical protein